jgi:hypothetical protein
MPEIKLRIADLVLDHDNPRITHSEGQQEALQKIVKDQRTKLVKLALSIAEHGLNPMDRLLVLRQHQKPERFIALEGNRRVAAFKLLSNPSVMSGLDMPMPMKKIFERLAEKFSKSKVEPIACYELASRKEGDYWLELRHQGERQGAGIVDWTSVASGRFRTRSPAIQALEMVTERGSLSAEQLSKITDKFPLSTLQRFVEDKKVRKAMGLDVKNGKLITTLPAKEVLKPLKKVVLDLATKQRRVGSLMKTDQMLDYVDGFDKGFKPDLSKAASEARTVDEIPISEFGKAARSISTRRRPDPSDRKEVVPKTCRLNITDNRIADIYKELRTIRLDDAPNSIAVMLRVFLELSVDHFLEANKISLDFLPPGASRKKFKELDKKLAEAVATLISIGIPAAHFKSVTRAVSDVNSPMHTDLLHRYVHDRYATPIPQDLKGAWDHAQPLFEKIWP